MKLTDIVCDTDCHIVPSRLPFRVRSRLVGVFDVDWIASCAVRVKNKENCEK